MIEERLDKVEQRLNEQNHILDNIMEILTSPKFTKELTGFDFRGRKFVVTQNVFSSIDGVHPMMKQGQAYKVGEDNGIKFRFGEYKAYFEMNKLLQLYGDKIIWLNDK